MSTPSRGTSRAAYAAVALAFGAPWHVLAAWLPVARDFVDPPWAMEGPVGPPLLLPAFALTSLAAAVALAWPIVRFDGGLRWHLAVGFIWLGSALMPYVCVLVMLVRDLLLARPPLGAPARPARVPRHARLPGPGGLVLFGLPGLLGLPLAWLELTVLRWIARRPQREVST